MSHDGTLPGTGGIDEVGDTHDRSGGRPANDVGEPPPGQDQ